MIRKNMQLLAISILALNALSVSASVDELHDAIAESIINQSGVTLTAEAKEALKKPITEYFTQKAATNDNPIELYIAEAELAAKKAVQKFMEDDASSYSLFSKNAAEVELREGMAFVDQVQRSCKNWKLFPSDLKSAVDCIHATEMLRAAQKATA